MIGSTLLTALDQQDERSTPNTTTGSNTSHYLSLTEFNCSQVRAEQPPLLYPVKLSCCYAAFLASLTAVILLIIALVRKLFTSFWFTFWIIVHVNFGMI